MVQEPSNEMLSMFLLALMKRNPTGFVRFTTDELLSAAGYSLYFRPIPDDKSVDLILLTPEEYKNFESPPE